jgi:3-phosphoshikimate 1-carboxyvinyltransferase
VPNYRTGPGGVVQGELTVPGDKSISHRSLMLGGIANGVTDITGFLAGEDCLATLRALQALGVKIERPEDQHVIVHGVGHQGLRATSSSLDMGNAGTAMRLSMGLLAPQNFDSVLIGDESLMSRPMERVATPLRLMGAKIATRSGRPPVEIRGNPQMHGIDYALPVASAQVKSAVLLAGLQASGQTRVTEPAPTRDHTERMLRAFGVKIAQQGSTATIEGGQTLRGTQIAVPADFSSAAFFLVAGCLAAEKPLLLRKVGVNPTRTGLLQLLLKMGADIKVHPHPGPKDAEPIADLEVRKSRLKGIQVPEDLVPLSIDEFPVFFIARPSFGEPRNCGSRKRIASPPWPRV